MLSSTSYSSKSRGVAAGVAAEGSNGRMSRSLLETILDGGAYWKREREDSPGHSIVIPNDTPFKIALEGAQSHRFAEGVVRKGYFCMRVGDAKVRYLSAHEAVNAIRAPSTNAFLYLHLKIGAHWISADDYRQSENTRLDRAEELALAEAVRELRRHPDIRSFDTVQVNRGAANLVTQNPERIDAARRQIAAAPNLLDLVREHLNRD